MTREDLQSLISGEIEKRDIAAEKEKKSARDQSLIGEIIDEALQMLIQQLGASTLNEKIIADGLSAAFNGTAVDEDVSVKISGVELTPPYTKIGKWAIKFTREYEPALDCYFYQVVVGERAAAPDNSQMTETR
jgi:hypothetical protein